MYRMKNSENTPRTEVHGVTSSEFGIPKSRDVESVSSDLKSEGLKKQRFLDISKQIHPCILSSTFRIIPVSGPIESTVHVPGSKSYTNRALIISALAGGRSILKDGLESEDITHMISSLQQLGISITKDGSDLVIDSIHGLKSSAKSLYLGGSGTGIRLLTSLSCLVDGKTVLTGNKRLLQRPMGELIDGLQQAGADVDAKSGNFPPITVRGKSLKGGTCTMQGSVSSQFFSSIMLAAPYADKEITIKVSGDLTSKPYIDITLDIMRAFGAKVSNKNYKKFIISNITRYSPKEYFIEGDASSSTYFFALAAITGSRIRVDNIKQGSVQGDSGFPYLLEKMGCDVAGDSYGLVVQGNRLRPISCDMNSMPDAVPSLAAVAAFADGKTTISNISNLRLKESDRINSIMNELRKIGIRTESTEDSLIIHGGNPKGPADIDTYDDHRIAMAFALVGAKVGGIRINDPGCTAKSFPGFWNLLASAGVGVVDG